MAQNVKLYNLLISCPGDIKEEVTLIESAVDEFNELYAETLGITIKTRHWSKSSYAQSGGKPQALLNEQFVNKCDAAVAIFWTRFGSPTDEYGSGTEEEIEIMLQSGKQVFMYFSDKPIPPSKINGDGYEKIQAFRDKYKDKGIYFTYSSDEEFKKMFFAHLSMHFLTEKRVSETANEYRSELKLLGIDETGRLTEEAVVCPFVLNAEITMKEYITSIKNMYQEISDMNVGGRSVIANTFFAGFTSPVDIDEDEKEFITAVAEQLECELSDSFFELGNLNQDTLTSNLLSGPKLNGTSEEKQKYWKIKRLHETISKALEWAPVEKAFSGMNCIKLAIHNCGKAIDEDAEIMFEDADDNAMTIEQYLHDYVIPQKGEELGATVRSADITEILISDLLEFVHHYSVPRYKLKNRSGKNNSQQGTDVIAYKYKNEDKTPNDKDELVAAEVKATLSNMEYTPIKNAIIDSRKDEHRLARTVNYCRKRLKELGKIEEAEEVKRFLFKPDNNYRIIYVAAGVSSRESVDDAIELDFSGEELEIRKNELIFYVHGKKLMELAHNIYQRCCK